MLCIICTHCHVIKSINFSLAISLYQSCTRVLYAVHIAHSCFHWIQKFNVWNAVWKNISLNRLLCGARMVIFLCVPVACWIGRNNVRRDTHFFLLAALLVCIFHSLDVVFINIHICYNFSQFWLLCINSIEFTPKHLWAIAESEIWNRKWWPLFFVVILLQLFIQVSKWV